MTRATRTNPAYAYLAYRKAVLEHTITYLMTEVIGANGVDPTARVLSEDVFREDEEVPREDVLSFVEELEEQAAEVKVEMGKFTFSRIDGDDGGTEGKKPRKTPRRRRAVPGKSG